MDHFLLPLLLPRFYQVGPYFSHPPAVGCGLAMAESVQGSDAATPGRGRRCSVEGWLLTKRRSAHTLPQRDLCAYVVSPTKKRSFCLALDLVPYTCLMLQIKVLNYEDVAFHLPLSHLTYHHEEFPESTLSCPFPALFL